jgi:hypothetical protein
MTYWFARSWPAFQPVGWPGFGAGGNCRLQSVVRKVIFAGSEFNDATIFDHCWECLHGIDPAAGFPVADDGLGAV